MVAEHLKVDFKMIFAPKEMINFHELSLIF
jgi:hypothetical protein